MPALTRLMRLWLPVLVWLGVIFAASSDLGASQHTSRLLGPVLRWLAPGLPDATIDLMLVLIRKAAHVMEYAVLALLIWRALRWPAPGRPGYSPAPATTLALIGCVTCAAADEFHQSFLPTRTGSAWDVLLDTAGAGAALAGGWVFERIRLCGNRP